MRAEPIGRHASRQPRKSVRSFENAVLAEAAAVRSLSRLRGRVGVGALSTMGFAEATPTRLALLGTLPRKREREAVPPRLSFTFRSLRARYPLAAPTLANRLRMRIDRVSQTSR